ncbi:MAG: anthranilate phosphoribosyltransferase, partial [Lachnospiraceae bacterium]|nr:anthranilate phosphoribosyltransferase [Lachnospiraceae bacterium]
MIIEATKKVVEKIDLTADEAAQVMDEMMSGEAEQIN